MDSDERTAIPLDPLACPLHGTRLIEASAGTGKTWNICVLVLRLLLERRLELRQILVVTFTNAATAELRERIRSRIAQALARLQGRGPATADAVIDELLAGAGSATGQTAAELALRLDRALQGFDEASIFTIHSFCQRALADTAFSAGMPLALDLLPDDRALRLQAVQDFWRRRIAGAALPEALAAHFLASGDSPDSHARLLARRLAKPLSTLVWPDDIDDDTPPDLEAQRAAHGAARACWLQQRDQILACVTEALPRLNANSYRDASVRAAAADWDALLDSDDALAAAPKENKLALLTSTRLRPKKNQAPPEPHAFFDLADQLLARRAANAEALSRQRLRLLRELLLEVPQALLRTKIEQRVTAFDDMLFNLHRRLAGAGGEGLAATLRARFPAALIDEFQDTDPLQFSIFSALHGDGPGLLALVGDPKQAIYGFRSADLQTYLRAREQVDAEYTLTHNQRSTAGLLAALNALFGSNGRAFMLDGLHYREVGFGAKPRPALVEAGTPLPPHAPLQLWTLPATAAEGQPLTKPLAQLAAAQACAGEIARLVGAGLAGEATLGGRAVAAGDIAVLVRSHAHGALMRAALAALGVGCVELSQDSVLRSPDAEELERVLAAMLEPARTGLLRAALATTLLGFDAAAIDTLTADEAVLLDTMARFSGYRQTWLRRGVAAMLREFARGESVHQRLLARPDGERRLTNLLHLGECLHEAAQTFDGAEAQLRWLGAARREETADDSAQLRLESDRNLVQIVTIHKSKGLEYGFVFCPFLWDGYRRSLQRGGDGVEVHDDEGRPLFDFSRPDADRQRVLDERRRIDAAAEDLRLVYVALTRAVHRCHLVIGSYVKGEASTGESERSLLNWLVAGQGMTPAQWLDSKQTRPPAAASWAALAASCPGHIGLAPLPTGPAAPLLAPASDADALAALVAPPTVPLSWWIGSYSSLTQGARHEAAAVDHELRLPPVPLLDRQPLTAADDDMLRFPRGPSAGDCVHAVFERIDFGDAGGWPAAIAAALQAHPQPGSEAALSAMLARMLGEVLHTPLPAGLKLAEVAPGRRLIELEFNLPAARLSAPALAAMLRDHGLPVPALSFGVLQGYLRGFIDLVFEHQGRWHIVDWKSNHLGDTPAHYGPAPLAQAMAEQGYVTQSLLYTLALHRWLGRRLQGYDYDTHVAGAHYLFVRGVRPGWQLDGAPAGVWSRRFERRTIEALSALFEAEEVRA